jgi:hypothetical protein
MDLPDQYARMDMYRAFIQYSTEIHERRVLLQHKYSRDAPYWHLSLVVDPEREEQYSYLAWRERAPE